MNTLYKTPENEDPSEQLWRELDRVDGDGGAARELLAAGWPIYYREPTTPKGLQIKEHPDGHRELVRFSRQGDEVIRAL
ncbi:hypothetical protein D5041_21070 [Verminephrobacter aporrectodeae subsp. tuberculatae]|uniref:Uncharacterized protein n=1 Tax=Verminephrobacter aporrectodeae subsp. tuberculatae TaxID=1110392 RepID=A0ABT3KVZ1_9BURK|nr:hypothetical protein [Verminephrobacter aporrectodeae]MCW5222132.1 hypothetical protein [Verminephrobacter aporrectodeae subsp. tuberculatae]MCW5291423.1 hypothetical protein [Verminephrobacter aporrectodeae subsp. tuberculatae]MCW5322406.1 hypothetical protein [Verminephrobacter aporrectodeae subsp. tuberculatae]